MSNSAKNRSMNDGKSYLKNTLFGVEKMMVLQLEHERLSQTHNGSLGDACERHWRDLLQKYLPARYQVEEAFVIDSTGQTSDQIDVVIFDATYTSPLHSHDGKKYLPRESIYAVFEAKQTVDKENLGYAGDKAESVRKLHCTSAAIVNAGRTCPPREIFEPLTGLLAYQADWSAGLESPSFQQNLPIEDERRLDFVITGKHGLFDSRQHEEPSLYVGEGSMMRGVFRLLQALQELGTVPAIDWHLYEKVLDEVDH